MTRVRRRPPSDGPRHRQFSQDGDGEPASRRPESPGSEPAAPGLHRTAQARGGPGPDARLGSRILAVRVLRVRRKGLAVGYESVTRARVSFLLGALSLGGSVGLLAWGCASGGAIRQLSPDVQVPLFSPGSGNQSATSQPAATSQAAGRDADSTVQPTNQQGAGNVSIAYAGGAILGVGGALWLAWSLVNNVITLKQDRHERDAWKEVALKCLEVIAANSARTRT